MQIKRTVTNIVTNRKAFPVNVQLIHPLRKMENFRAYFGVYLDAKQPAAVSLYPEIYIWTSNAYIGTIRLSPNIPKNILHGAIDPMKLMHAAKVLEKESDAGQMIGWICAIQAMATSVIAPLARDITFLNLPGIRAIVMARLLIGGRRYKCQKEAFVWREFLHVPYGC